MPWDLSAAELNDYVEQVEDTEHRLHDRSGWASTILQNHSAAVAKRQADQINRLTLVSISFLPLTSSLASSAELRLDDPDDWQRGRLRAARRDLAYSVCRSDGGVVAAAETDLLG